MATINGTPGDDNFDDALVGTPENDQIFGFEGEDWLTGNEGDDTLDGGPGSDRVFYSDDPAGITADFGAGIVVDGFGSTDTLVDVEWIFGTDFADTIDGGDVAPSNDPYWLFGQGGDDVLKSLDPDRFSDLDGGDGNDTLINGNGNSFLKPVRGDDTVTGGGGFDGLDYFFESRELSATEASGIIVNFSNATDGTVIDFAGDTDAFTGIEGVYGTNFEDILTGAEGRQNFAGFAGDDTIDGGAGNDDVVEYDRAERQDGATVGVTVDLTAGTATDPYGDTDTLISIEDVRGTIFDDIMFGATGSESRLRGDDGNDSLTGADDDFQTGLSGGAGNDTLDGGSGGAYIDPGSGNDLIIGGAEEDGFYSIEYIWDADRDGATNGIVAVFDSERGGTVTDYAGGTDTFTGIDRVQGTMLADSFTGADGNQDFRGYGGDDVFDGGAGDRDRVDYSSAREEFGNIGGVTVDLTAGTATDPYGDTDTLIGIEEVRGTDFDDVMSGSPEFTTFLDGGDGDDVMDAGSEIGFSQLFGGNGDDILTMNIGDGGVSPGAGNDTISGSNREGDFNEITYFSDARNAGSDAVSGIIVVYDAEGAGTISDYAGDTDTFTNIDAIRGTEMADSFTGSDGQDRFSGLAGNDTFDGGAGRDQVDYWWSRFAGGTSGVTVDLTAGTATDPFGDTDTLISIEDIRGTIFDDVIFGATGTESQLRGDEGNDSLTGADDDFFTDLNGGAGNDTLDGGSGGAFIEPGTGTDLIMGGTAGEGFYELSYIFASRDDDMQSGITVTFTSERDGAVADGAGDTDTFSGIDRVRGTLLDDSFVGADGNQTFMGFAGNDTFDGGTGDGDRVDYSRAREDLGASQGVVVDLEAGTATDAYGDTDTLINIEEVRGSVFDDQLTGSSGRDELQGEGGNDTLEGGAGDDYMGGGDGVDTAVFAGAAANYILYLGGGPNSDDIEDKRADGTGYDSFDSIELLEFGDGFSFIAEGAVDLRALSGAKSLTEEQFSSFIELYIAYFNRAPDAIGLNFWGTAFANGTTLEEMATLFVDQDETRATYPDGTSNTEFATSVYDNVLGRTPDQAGLDFWVDELNNDAVSRDQFILEVLRGAKSDLKPEEGQAFVDQQLADRAYLEDKVDIGAYFAVHKGMSDVDNASSAMVLFDGTEQSIENAVNAIDSFYAEALDPTDGEFLMPVIGVLDDPFAL